MKYAVKPVRKYRNSPVKRLHKKTKKRNTHLRPIGKAVFKSSKFFVLLAVIGMVGYGLYWSGGKLLTWDKGSYLKEIQFSGNHFVSKERILVKLPIKFGQKLWSISPQELTSHLLENPWIEEASVSRRWPGKLLIHIKERTPLAVMSVQGRPGNWMGFSESGELLPRVDIAKGNWPIIDYSKYWTESLRWKVGKFLLIAKTKYPEIYNGVSQVSLFSNESIFVFYGEANTLFQISLDSDFEAVLEHWGEFIKATENQIEEGSIVDLRVPGYAFVRRENV